MCGWRRGLFGNYLLGTIVDSLGHRIFYLVGSLLCILLCLLVIDSLHEGLGHGGRAFLDGISHASQFKHHVGVDLLAFLNVEVGIEHLLGNAELREVADEVLSAGLQVEGFSHGYLLDLVDHLLDDGLGDDFQDSVAECDGAGGIAGDHLHVLAECTPLLVGDAAFHLDADGNVCLQIEACTLGCDGLAVVGDDAGLYSHVTPCACDDLGHADRQSLDELLPTLTGAAQSVEAVLGRLLVHGGVGLDLVEHGRQVARVSLCRCDLHVDGRFLLGLNNFGLLNLDDFAHDC